MFKRLLYCVCALTLLGSQSSGQPLLSVSESNQFITVTWPVSLPEFTLQATTNLSGSINWLGITQGIAASGGLNSFLTNSTGQNSLFFRLTRSCATNDLPDALFADENCDGIDGDIGTAVFVATDGADNPAGGTMQSPFRTITYAIQRAQAAGKNQVLIRAGTYSESVNLANGVGLYGGFDVNWVRGPHTLPGHAVTIQGGFNSTEQQFITLCASDSQTNEVTDLEIVGPTATTNGLSSYAVYVRQSSLMLNRVTITAGAGAAGQTGANGSDALQTDAQPSMNGATGGNAAQYVVSCDNTSHGAGGASGSNGGTTQGGVGGNGGTMDTTCGLFGCIICDATPGQSGGNADFVVAPYGQGGFGGNASGGPAQPGQNGVVSNGGAGSKGNGYQLQGNFFFTHSGSAGAIGQNGGGGGGGGGSGGNDNATDSYGAGGGGGGAGGLAARGGGSGGQGGGSSFGIFAVNATVGLTNSTITLGSGGNGGAGGAGGRGQSGGQGGFGGAAAGSSPVGGNGGHGGHGGHGGGGGGGQGGYSVGMAYYNSILGTGSVIFSGGDAGLGGQGGAAAPTAPAGEQDGNAGQAGLAGILANVLSLSLSVP